MTTTTRPRVRWRRWTGIRITMAAIIVATGLWLAVVASLSASIAASTVLDVPASSQDLTFAAHLYVMAALGMSAALVIVAGFRGDRRWLYPTAPAIVAGVAVAVAAANRTPGPDTFGTGRSITALWFGSSLALMFWVLMTGAVFAVIDRLRRA